MSNNAKLLLLMVFCLVALVVAIPFSQGQSCPGGWNVIPQFQFGLWNGSIVQNGCINYASGDMIFTANLTSDRINSTWVMDPAKYANIAALQTAFGSTNPVHAIIPSTYTGTDCPNLQNNNVFEDYRAGGRSGSGNSTFICTNNIIQYNPKTPGLTDAMIRTEMTRGAVDATGSIVSSYLITHLNNATVTGGVVDGISSEVDIDGTLSGNLNYAVGNESPVVVKSTGGTITNAEGIQGYVFNANTSTTQITNASGVRGRGCSGVISGTAPTNCYGGFFDRQSEGASRNYSVASAGLSLFMYSSGSTVGGFDCEDASNVTHPCFRLDSGGNVVITPPGPGNLNLTGPNGTTQLVASNTGVRFQTGVYSDGSGFKHARVAGCATTASAGAVCTTSVTWGTTFADANYTASCSGDLVTSGVPINGGLSAKAAGSVTVRTVAATAAAAAFTTIDCIAVHD